MLFLSHLNPTELLSRSSYDTSLLPHADGDVAIAITIKKELESSVFR